MNAFIESLAGFPEDLGKALWIFGIAGLYMGLMWFIVDRLTPFDDWEELFEKGNVAYLCQRIGILAAQPIAMWSVVSDFDVSHPFWSAWWLFLEATFVFVALIIAYFFVDLVLFPSIRNRDLLLEGKTSVGIVEGGFYIGIGFLLQGSLTGTAKTLLLSVASTAVFYALGLVFVGLVFYLHEWWTPYCVRDEIKGNNIPVAIELFGVLVSTSVAVSVAVGGDFTNWVFDLLWFLLTAVVSVALLYALRWVSNRVLVRRHTVKEILAARSVTAASFQATIMILASFGVRALMSVV